MLTPSPQPRGHLAAQPIIDLTQSDAATSTTIDGYILDEYDDRDIDSDWVTTDSDSSCYSDDHDEDDNGDLTGAQILSSKTLRRSVPLSTLRERPAASPGASPRARDGLAPETQHVECSRYSVDTMPYLPDEFYDSSVFCPMEAVARVASQIPLPGPTFGEELFYTGGLMAVVGREKQEGHHFGSEPPHVPGGIAVREEAEEAGLADIVTQV